MSRRAPKKSAAIVRASAAETTTAPNHVSMRMQSVEIEFSEPVPAGQIGRVVGALLSPLLSRMFPGLPLPPAIPLEALEGVIEEKPREVPAVVESSRNIEEEKAP